MKPPRFLEEGVLSQAATDDSEKGKFGHGSLLQGRHGMGGDPY